VPYQDFPTADGHMILAIGNDGQFARFGHAIGAPEWAADARFVRNDGRLAHRTELVERIRAVTVTRSTRDWIALLEQHAVPCGPINTVRDVFEDPQVKARGLQIAMQHPQAGEVPLVASPIRLSDTPVTYRHTPPQLGQHTDEVLSRHLGLTAEALQTHRDNGVLG
jgi:crotonobetainyl-CoA:carnitine CoA-transferase CaiB-like acyl-CoA transferase